MRLSLLFVGTLATSLLNLPASAQTPRNVPPTASAAVSAQPTMVMYECDQSNCDQLGGVWVFEGNRGHAVWRIGEVADLTIKQFDGQHIVIDRVDPPDTAASRNFVGNGGSFRVEYTGTVSGNRMEGTDVWDKAPGYPVTWSATMPTSLCATAQDCPLTTALLLTLGGKAYEANQKGAALLCFLAAANQGDALGEAVAAYVLYEEKGSSARQAEGFQLAQRSAAANNAVGMIVLADMYRDGVGTKPDVVQAKFWFDKGEAQKALDDAARQQQQIRINFQQMLLAGVAEMLMSGSTGDDGSSGSGMTPMQQRGAQRAWQQTYQGSAH